MISKYNKLGGYYQTSENMTRYHTFHKKESLQQSLSDNKIHPF